MHDLAAVKERLLIPELWARLGLPGQARVSCRSPFRPERQPSFSIYDSGRQWKDHGTGEGGDAIDFLARACHLDVAEATRRFLVLAGVTLNSGFPPAARRSAGSHSRPATKLQLPPLHQGSPAELQAVARHRHLSTQAVSLAQSLRTLAFGNVCGHPCWILGDEAGRLAEARRLDGRPFPAQGPLGERKAHTLRGSRKDWPCGTAVLRRHPSCRIVMLVEGGPDYLAALHLLLALDRWDILPIALLGRSTGTRLCPQALALLAGRHVRLYPHADADGGGTHAAQGWAQQLHQHGCTCDFFNFTALHQTDGTPVKDLNDAVLTRSDQLPELAALLP